MPKTDLTKTINILSNPLYIFTILLGCGLLVFLILMFKQSGFKKPQGSLDYFQVQIQDKEKTIIFNKDGRVEFKTPTTTLQQQWEQEKLNAILSALKEKIENTDEEEQATLNIGENYQVTLMSTNGTNLAFKIGKDNQILQEIFDFFTNPETGGETVDSDWFSHTSPPPSAGGETGGGTFGGSGGRPADCPLWILSMCVYPQNWAFSPAPSPSAKMPSPLPSSEKPKPTKSPAAPDCTLWNQLITGKTVISNTLCIKEQK